MAIIYSYPTSTPATGDLLIGTDITGEETQNFTVGSVVTAGISTHIAGTANKVPLFTGANIIGDSIITQSSSKIGIGTSSPVAKLEVNGTININNSGDRLFIADPGQGTFSLGDLDAVSSEAQIVSDGVDMLFKNDDATTMAVTYNNRVGIGTTSPASKLEVDGGDIEIDDSASGLILKSPNGTRYRVTVANGGTLSVTAV